MSSATVLCSPRKELIAIDGTNPATVPSMTTRYSALGGQVAVFAPPSPISRHSLVADVGPSV